MSTELQNDETSGSDTVSASISNPRTHSIRTESLFTESRASSILSQLSEIEQDDTFKPNEEQRKRVKNFLGYYECLIDNSKLSNLSIPTISISTARIDLHKVINRKTDLKEGKHWVSTKIKESPCIKNTSLFVITEWTGTKFNEFPRWMQYVVHLLDGIPVKGLGNYEVFIKKAINTNEISEDTLEMLKSEAEKEDDTNHKLALAGIYMKGNERNNGNYYETNKCYIEAKDLCLKAAKLGSIEAKLCLGYIYSVGFTKNKKSKLESDYQPNKAKKLFKKVARNKNDNRIARIAMRNIATLFHCEEIKPKFLEKVKNIGFGTKKPLYLQKAEKWYRKSLGLEDSQSAYQLGLLYESNFNESINDKIEENKKEAEVLFEKAVSFEDDNLYAKAKLGRILINNKIDESRGLKLLEKAAETLDMGQTYLGEFYEKTEDYVKAVEFYSKAARQNRGYYSHAAQYHLNKLKGDGHVNKNIKDILRNYGNERDYGYIGTEETFERIL
ncbi:unnamed protein product [Rhizophagus irregularis]|nr:unnamed protein product [Rhizophagus irregularis]